MATPAEIRAAMTGFPRTLKWSDFPVRTTSPSPPMEAQTGSSYSWTSGTLKLVAGEYRFHGAKATVSLSHASTWAIPSARSSADLLTHEQGHYDITGLVARDFISKVLDLSIHEVIIDVLNDSGHTPNDHMHFVSTHFNAEVARFDQSATALMNRLQTDPNSGQDGLYDTQTGHSQDLAGQTAWNDRLNRAKPAGENFELWLLIEGVI